MYLTVSYGILVIKQQSITVSFQFSKLLNLDKVGLKMVLIVFSSFCLDFVIANKRWCRYSHWEHFDMLWFPYAEKFRRKTRCFVYTYICLLCRFFKTNKISETFFTKHLKINKPSNINNNHLKNFINLFNLIKYLTTLFKVYFKKN